MEFGNLKNLWIYGFVVVFSTVFSIFWFRNELLYKFNSQEKVLGSENISNSERDTIENNLLEVSQKLKQDSSPEINLQSIEEQVTLNFTGDVILGRSVNTQSIKKGDFSWAFRNIYKDLQSADLTIINLESPLLEKCPLTDGGFIFCGDKRHLEGLKLAGVDVVGASNNHFGDYGNEGVLETVKRLKEENIGVSGLREYEIFYQEVKGTKFAFLAFSDLGSRSDLVRRASEEDMKKFISEARLNSDFVVVQMHWGDEYQEFPNQRQKDLGRKVVDFGADLVIGNHPHWIQGYEIYQNKHIFYALGNFIFDQEWSQKTKEGVILKAIIQNKKMQNFDFTPIEIRNYGQVFKTEDFEIIPKNLNTN